MIKKEIVLCSYKVPSSQKLTNLPNYKLLQIIYVSLTFSKLPCHALHIITGNYLRILVS